MATYSPYRDPPLTPEERDVKVWDDVDISDVTVEIIWQNKVGDIGKAQLVFEGDEDIYRDQIVKVDRRYGTHPRLKSGQIKFDEFLHSGYARGFVYINDHVVPWHRIFQFHVIKKVERRTITKWRYEDSP